MRLLFALAVLCSSVSLAADKLGESPPTPPAPMVQTQGAEESRWPGAHTLGLRAGLGGSTATPGIDVGNVGIKFLLTDSLALSADLGLGISSGNGVGGGSSASFAVDALVSIYVRGPDSSLRPYVPLLFGVGVSNETTGAIYNAQGNLLVPGQSSSAFQLALGAGFGAEYWFSKSFSMAADLMLRLEITSVSPFAVNFGTLTPGIHATYYL